MMTRDLKNIIYMTELDDITMEITLAFYKGDSFIKDNIKIVPRPIFCDLYKVAEVRYTLEYIGEFYDTIKSIKKMRKNRVPFTNYKKVISDNTNNLIRYYLNDYHLDNTGIYDFHKLYLNTNDKSYSMWCTNKIWKSDINGSDDKVFTVINDDDFSRGVDQMRDAINIYIDRSKKRIMD